MAGETYTRRLTSLLFAAALTVPGIALADSVRVATYNVSMARAGPGLLLKELRKSPVTEQIANVIAIIREVNPDILLVNELDYDGGEESLSAFAALLADAGALHEYQFAATPNTGFQSGHDLDGDGEANGPGDAFGYGRFPGQYGMAILSRYPIDRASTRTFTKLRWMDFPGAIMPVDASGGAFPSEAAQEVMRLSSKAHWDVSVVTPDGPLRLLASHPTPPVFDGVEDLNGRRNHDEILFWARYLDGDSFTDDAGLGAPMASGPFVILGDLNADPEDGDGRRSAISTLLSHPRLVDPRPESAGGAEAATLQGGTNETHSGDPALDTSDWNDNGPGNLRVDYVLPSSDLSILGSGVFWPDSTDSRHILLGKGESRASDHHLVWVDIMLPNMN